MTTRYQTLGQKLGRYALFLARRKPCLRIIRLPKADGATEDPWANGTADTAGNSPMTDPGCRMGLTGRHSIQQSLSLRGRRNSLLVTGNREKILALAALGTRVGKELVVQGQWCSADNVTVDISAAYGSPRERRPRSHE